MQNKEMIPYIVLFLLVLCSLAEGDERKTVEQYLNRCLDGLHHKQKPGPEGSLYDQCSPWKKWSCCQANVTENIHKETLYKFNIHHCKRLSKRCLQHFIQDLCFYQCTPNGGPWIHKESNMKIRKERYFELPLCRDTCEEWWDSCKDDETCSGNWMRGFNWTTGTNTCVTGSKCQKISEVFKTSTNFCEKVWDHSWKVVSQKPCFVLWFDEKNGNPNNQVAFAEAYRLTSEASYPKPYSYSSVFMIVYNFIFAFVLQYSYCDIL
ncbi:Hypothetical predicted protein [Octopus vulgaris]|uniref:Folate receptor-like domain-containing protein n=3 Tax=Octopus TaxID=6643 RepID=A0AA36F1V1_OCTVU|nr:Hypothetical predicted protein [Octopus vulgaris]